MAGSDYLSYVPHVYILNTTRTLTYLLYSTIPHTVLSTAPSHACYTIIALIHAERFDTMPKKKQKRENTPISTRSRTQEKNTHHSPYRTIRYTPYAMSSRVARSRSHAEASPETDDATSTLSSLIDTEIEQLIADTTNGKSKEAK